MLTPLWRQIQRSNFTKWSPLLEFLELREDPQLLKESAFPLNLPLRLAQKIRKGCWDDPLLRQFLPRQEEEILSPLFKMDPVEDKQFKKTPKLLHKYNGRALLMPTSACAMHCRYCFRRHFDYDNSGHGSFEEEISQIVSDPSLSEILLSGGDPLSLSDRVLGDLLQRLDQIPHVKRIRFHTRFPIGIPERITPSFLAMLRSCSKQIYMVIHCNHPHEMDEHIFSALLEIQKLGIPVLSQSVLLKGVNDDVAILENLFLSLANRGILPYYLHQLDRVQGAAHFEVCQEKGQDIMEQLQKILPGYALPRYVKEEPFAPHKTLITSCRGS